MTSHIKIPRVPPFISYYANGEQSTFEYPFPVFASEDMAVRLNGALQVAGYTVSDAGETEGGAVTFAAAPATGVVVTLERRLPIERMTDYTEGGEFSAASINTELDYLVASIQQVERDQGRMLRVRDTDPAPATVYLPGKNIRAGKALGFDDNGDMTALPLDGATMPVEYTGAGAGAVVRSVVTKLSDIVSVRDYGAAGDGLTDDTIAFQNALAASLSVFVPPGQYIIGSTLVLGQGQSLTGAGQASVIECTADDIAVIDMRAGYARLAALRINGGQTGVLLRGVDSPCVHNTICDVTLWEQESGIVLDGYDDTDKPCYWNLISRVLVARPTLHGVHLKKSGAGDSPNANRFTAVRVYSLAAETTGCGVYVEEGRFANSFTDCEVNITGTAQACVRVGSACEDTFFVNLFTESYNIVPNVQLDEGSAATSIVNLLAASNGSAILDYSGGNYTAINAGYPHKNRLNRTLLTDATAQMLRFDALYTDTSGAIDLDMTRSVHLLSSYAGALTARLPNAADANGCYLVVKKIDVSKNVITISEIDGNGPDGIAQFLGAENDYVAVLSNGAEWFVVASNRSAGNNRFFDGSGLYEIDLAVDTYLVSSYSGAVTARLPPADSLRAIGRMVTIKKTDPSGNTVTVTEQGGAGPDQTSHALSSMYDAITVVSDGSQWYVVSRYP